MAAMGIAITHNTTGIISTKGITSTTGNITDTTTDIIHMPNAGIVTGMLAMTAIPCFLLGHSLCRV
jgi:hypothetical protein